MTIFFLSDGYRGGTANFLEQNVIYNLKKKRNVVLFDKNQKKTFPNLKKNKYLKVYNIDIFKDIKKVEYLIRKIQSSKNIIFFTNFAIHVYYFIFFNRLKKNSFKIVLSLHSGVFKYSIKTLIGIGLFSLITFKLDSIVFGSYTSRNWWLRLIPWIRIVNHKVIFNGIELQKKKKKKINLFKISFIGRLEDENDPELFLKLFLLNKNSKNIIFNVFGDGSLKNKYLKKYKQVKFWGWTKKNKIYSNTDITVITSPINNFPYVALESSSYGIPVITAARGDIRKIVKNNYNGYIFNYRTVKNFDLFLNKTIINYKRLSKNALKNAKKFEVNKSCQKIWRFLKIENYNLR